jgi:hypothetical protein
MAERTMGLQMMEQEDASKLSFLFFKEGMDW